MADDQGRRAGGAWTLTPTWTLSRRAAGAAAVLFASAAAGPVAAQAVAAPAPVAETQAPPARPAAAAPVPSAPASTPTPAPAPTPAAAPKPKPADDDADDDDAQVTVTANRPQRGAVVGDIKPELQLAPADIQSYGVSTVTELLNELAPQTRSDRGRGATTPVVLLNGRRISSLNEVQNIPTEAILRVDILPEEVSLKYGYTADQRVVNIVLKPRFDAVTGELVGGTTTDGGDDTGQAEVDKFQVRRGARLNLDVKYQAAQGLTDAQRGLVDTTSGGTPYDLAGNVVSPTAGAALDPAFTALVGQPVTIAGVPAGVTAGQHLSLADFVPTAGVGNVTNTAADHSLVPQTQSLTANAVWAKPIFWGLNATFNATLGATTSQAMQGLPGVSLTTPAGDPFSPFSEPVVVDRYVAGAAPLRQTIDGFTSHMGLTVNRDVGAFRLSLTTAYNHADTITTTGTGLDASGLQTLLTQDSASFNPFGPLPLAMLNPLPNDTARSITNGGNIQFLLNGPLFRLPAGAFYISAKIGDSEAGGSSTSQHHGLTQSQSLARNDISGLFNFDLPLASRANHFLSPLGELSANVNTAVDDLSDFGPLYTLGYGVNWTPVTGYNLIISETHDHQAPTIQQLEGPVIATPGVRLFDYTTGQTVSVTQLSGGNPALKADDRHVVKVGLTLKPWPKENFTFTANYIWSHIANPIETFPSASAAIEAAFPMRFIRAPDGELEEEDNRPLNFTSQDRQELRWGINYSRPVGKQPPPPAFDRRALMRRRPAAAATGVAGQGAPGQTTGAQPGGPPGGGPGGRPPGQQLRGIGGGAATDDEEGDEADTPPNGQNPIENGTGAGGREGGGGAGGARGGGFGGGGFGGGRGGGFGGRGGGDGGPVGGRFQIALYHTVFFKDQFQVASGGPLLDLLHGAAAGGTGGQYQQEIEAQIGYTNGGYGARMSADWRSATVVTGGAVGSTGDLDFSDIATINIRVWNDFNQQPELTTRYHILKGVRVTFNVSNLFNQSIQVHDTAGPTPAIYQSAYLNPTGRVVSINLRKIFY